MRLSRIYIRSLLIIFASLWILHATFGQDSDADSTSDRHALMPAKYRAVFKTYCYDCHDSATKEGTVDLESIPFKISQDIEVAERWAKILNAINSGEMPPQDSDPIADKDKLLFLEELSKQMVAAREIMSDSGGVITLRRLNRREYANTIESLLGVHPDVSSLPNDQATAGFDTHGNSLFFSSDQLEQYLATAEDALRLGLQTPVRVESKTVRVEPEDFYNQHYADALAAMEDDLRRAKAYAAQSEKPPSDFGFLDEYQAKKRLSRPWIPLFKDYLSRSETKNGATMIMTIKQGGYTRIKLPQLRGEKAVGKYLIRVRAAAYPDAEKRLHYLEFSSSEKQSRKRLGWRKVVAPLDQPEIIEFPFEHRPGQEQQIQIHQRSHQDRADKNLTTTDREKNGIGTPPGLWVDWAELVGPLPDEDPSQTREKILFDKRDGWSDEKYAKEVLRQFATDAFRGKAPSDEYLDRLLGHFRKNFAKEQSLEKALIKPLSIVLASPSFLYLQESVVDEKSKLLSDRELAVRLSYFLWSAPPDGELASLAESGKLSQADVLREQTKRLLTDKRASEFVQGFVYQWLEMHRLGMFQFNGAQFRTYDNAVRESAAEEIYQTVHFMLEEKLPLRTLLKADFVVINDILADYYGFPEFVGHEFRKVSVPKDSTRGGLIGTAAVLSMGSDGVRASAVERGAWILRHLLHDSPPPAPPNVPMLNRFEGEHLSARELARSHQEQPQCAQCHQKIDPIGFGLENFDASGSWRDKETVGSGRFRYGKRQNETQFDIDPSGQLPGGVKFANYQELREKVATYEDEFARGLVEDLIAYGLGRPYGFTDEPLADTILKNGKRTDYEINLLIMELVQSEAFRSR